jgi:hypothetical protein
VRSKSKLNQSEKVNGNWSGQRWWTEHQSEKVNETSPKW